jgi:hypothetical protein
MKNIHILPTDKPSRLFTWGNKLRLGDFVGCPDYFGKLNKNIYITYDEEIKEVDYVIQINFEKTNIQVIKCENESQVKIANSKNGSFTKNKIILTTDQDLIKDGVQAIDDEFLEWFVKNPSCERVEIYDINNKWHKEDGSIVSVSVYKIILPKEEPKQEKDYTALLQPVGTKQTALQQLINDFTELSKKEGDSGFVGRSVLAIVKNKKYLEMEKKQIIDSFNEGWLQCNIYGLPEKSRKHFETAEQYYSETFSK